ncbi:hypothetical protein [Pelagicoccus mobilis]|uniref:Lipoprotein n=1 Tax=Pelagicoccus mobilis TaxID=415221 RepID=A0A934RX54_9BACT|nr:hypothetical protein [Pelagicoccus mobilis]MBK1878417.1 hypothetical protein [Pelagicoccus mobilis]
MKTRTFRRFLAPFSLFSLCAVSACLAGDKQDGALSGVVDLKSEKSESRCVMVFAKVGERFRYEFKEEKPCPSLECAPGINALGEESALPQGLGFNADEFVLEGIPMRPGFHEYVVMRTEKGVTREHVVLIDIQEHSFAAGGVEYASYLAGGMR